MNKVDVTQGKDDHPDNHQQRDEILFRIEHRWPSKVEGELDEETGDDEVELLKFVLFAENRRETDGERRVKNSPNRTNNPTWWLKEGFVF